MLAATLLMMALKQRWTRRGPQDIEHCQGIINTMADIPSRSYKELPGMSDEDFLAHFANKFPLPPQLKSWTFARPSDEVFSVACLLL